MFETVLRHLDQMSPSDEELRSTIYLHMASTSLSLDDIEEAEKYCEQASICLYKYLKDPNHRNCSKVTSNTRSNLSF